MIEVEKKFSLSEEDKQRLIKDAEFLGEKIYTDTYYDTPDFSLTKKDIWLRSRNNDWELKIALQIGERKVDQYQELTTQEEIREALKLSKKGTLLEDLQEQGYVPFCVCKTTRQKYKKGSFGIDLDTVDYGDFKYSLGEIEVMVEEGKTQEAIDSIITFAKEHNLSFARVRGKVTHYLKTAKPDHFQALVDAGIIRGDDGLYKTS